MENADMQRGEISILRTAQEQRKLFDLQNTNIPAIDLTMGIKAIYQTVFDDLRRVDGLKTPIKIDLKKTIGDYYSNEDKYHYNPVVTKCDDMKLLSFSEIKKLIEEDDDYNKKILRLGELQSKIKLKDSSYENKLLVEEAMSLIGFSHKYNGLYRWLVPDDIDLLDIKLLDRNLGLFTVIVEKIGGLCVNGGLLTYGIFGTIMSQGRTKYLYRGENAYWGSSNASFFRYDPSSELPFHLQLLVNKVKQEEMGMLLNKFDIFQQWGHTTVNHLALMQHYGLKTQLLDFTSDLLTALFFACCHHEGKGNWKPLSVNDYKCSISRKDISDFGGDSRYAVIHRACSEINDYEWCLKDNESNVNNLIAPVGYQPFVRCLDQYAYQQLIVDQNYNLLHDQRYDHFRICLSDELCNWVFKKMHKGRNVFNNYQMPELAIIADRINQSKKISMKCLQDVVEIYKVELSDISNFLCKFSYDVTNDIDEYYSEDEIDAFNKKYTIEDFMTQRGVNPRVQFLLDI